MAAKRNWQCGIRHEKKTGPAAYGRRALREGESEGCGDLRSRGREG